MALLPGALNAHFMGVCASCEACDLIHFKEAHHPAPTPARVPRAASRDVQRATCPSREAKLVPRVPCRRGAPPLRSQSVARRTRPLERGRVAVDGGGAGAPPELYYGFVRLLFYAAGPDGMLKELCFQRNFEVMNRAGERSNASASGRRRRPRRSCGWAEAAQWCGLVPRSFWALVLCCAVL